MKIKSVSDNNLENIVKQMINVALKDSDQIVKLHQAIYEEWYFKKMMELRDTRNKMKNEIPSCRSNNLTKNISNGVDLMDAQRGKTRKKLKSITEHQNREQNEEKLAKQVRRKLSFESWKEGKNLIYRKLLKEAEEQKQRELQKKLEEIECKKASQEVYAQIIKEKEIQQRRELKQLQMIQQINMKVLQKQNNERRIINDQAFNVWKRQKDIKLKEAKENASYQRLKRSMGPTTLTERPSIQFDSWLDQLDSVLRKRYFWKRHHLIH